MTTPVSFDATTPRHALAMLVPGQAQKELSVNETFARIDALLHPAVEGEATTPPQDPVAGECWIVAQPASGAWQGHVGELACWDGTQWTLCTPIDGMQVFDRSQSSRIVYAGGWNVSSGRPLPREADLSMSRHGLRSRQLSTSLQHYRSFHEPDGNPIRASPFGTIRKGSKFPELVLTIRESGNIVTVPTYCLLAT